jgi:hypothetical protein
MDRPAQFPEIAISFSPSWWLHHYGMECTREHYMDPIARTERDREQRRILFDRFGDVGLGERDPEPRPTVEAYGDRFMAAFWGCEIDYYPDQDPAAVAFADPWERMGMLALPDPATSPVVRKAREDAQLLIARYGTCSGSINVGGPLNNGVSVFGEDLLAACLAEPDMAQQVLQLMAQAIIAVRDTVSIPIMQTTGASRQIGFGIGNCPVCMISPQTYRDVVLPSDQWLCRHFAGAPGDSGNALQYALGSPGLHHCGVFHPYVDAYQGYCPAALDIGWGSDLRITRAAYPNIPIALQIQEVALGDGTAQAIDALIVRMIDEAGPAQLVPAQLVPRIWLAGVGAQLPDAVVRNLMTVGSRVQLSEGSKV